MRSLYVCETESCCHFIGLISGEEQLTTFDLVFIHFTDINLSELFLYLLCMRLLEKLLSLITSLTTAAVNRYRRILSHCIIVGNLPTSAITK